MMQPETMPAVRSRPASVKSRRHALLGVGCALGLVLAPLAGSAVVVAVTSIPRPVVAVAAGPDPTSVAPPAPVSAAISPVSPSPKPVEVPRRGRIGR
jgi:hypothetical protein